METRKFKASTWRREMNLTQQDVADKLGVSKPTVVKWERENAVIPDLVKYALAKLYGVEVNEIEN